MIQADLFISPAPTYIHRPPEAEALGWESRALDDLMDGPALACPGGFMGHVYERLVAKGLATREDAGFMQPPKGLDGRPVKWPQGHRAADYPQSRYTLSAAGRAILATEAA